MDSIMQWDSVLGIAPVTGLAPNDSQAATV